jgi:hypothetical protein
MGTAPFFQAAHSPAASKLDPSALYVSIYLFSMKIGLCLYYAKMQDDAGFYECSLAQWYRPHEMLKIRTPSSVSHEALRPSVMNNNRLRRAS